MKLTKEQIEQLKACTTVEELKAYAESLGGKITDEQAVEALKVMDAHRIPEGEGKISDDALADVDGGSFWGSFAEGFVFSAMTIAITCVIVAVDDLVDTIKGKKDGISW